MNSTYTFSPDDMMNPIYCRECRTHIPRDVSTEGSGLCLACFSKREQANVSRDAQRASNVTQQASVAASQKVQTPNMLLINQEQHSSQPDIVLDEMARQYKKLSWLVFFGVFLLVFYFIGVLVIIYAMVLKSAFRRKVAEMGHDPEAWERPLCAHSDKVLLACVAAIAIICCVGSVLARQR